MSELVLDVRAMRKPDRNPQIFEQFNALAVGESFVLINNQDPRHLYATEKRQARPRRRSPGRRPRPCCDPLEFGDLVENAAGADDDARAGRCPARSFIAHIRRCRTVRVGVDEPAEFDVAGADHGTRC
jgi:hypothetical protein